MAPSEYTLPSADLLTRDGGGVRIVDFLTTPEGRSNASPLAFAVGQTSAGRLLSMDLPTIRHLLVGGSIGSGVTTFVNSLLVSLLMRATPSELKVVLIDPSMTYLTAYEAIPHLITPIIAQPKKAAQALAWLVKEMDRRWADMRTARASHIDEVNEAAKARRSPTYPCVVAVVSELTDLMMAAPQAVEAAVVGIGRRGVAAGIHLVLATRRPSADVLTAPITTHIPSRLAFATRSAIDSRVILGSEGAEQLTGRGDGLLLATGTAEPSRLRGESVTSDEVRAVVAAAKAQAGADYIDGVTTQPRVHQPIDEEIGADTDLFFRAVALVVASRFGSPSLLQRKLRIGSAKATRLLELLEARNIVGR